MMNFIKHIVNEDLRYKDENFSINGHLHTNSGVILSIQASSFHYCEPRENLEDMGEYETLEIAFINESTGLIDDVLSIEEVREFKRIKELMEYKSGTIFAYVPKDLVEDLYIHLNL